MSSLDTLYPEAQPRNDRERSRGGEKKKEKRAFHDIERRKERGTSTEKNNDFLNLRGGTKGGGAHQAMPCVQREGGKKTRKKSCNQPSGRVEKSNLLLTHV